MHHVPMQTAFRIAVAWVAFGWLAGIAHAGEEVPVDGFEMLRVCACDCVNQYEVRVHRTEDADLACRGLRDDGQWTDVKQSPYTPVETSTLLFHSRDRFSQFLCERRPSL
ncbi:MAG: hypothetical protein OXF78_06985 [Rhodospirillales bacterium]|nr:hypothetical protein [Rhodospirillales bacterium]